VIDGNGGTPPGRRLLVDGARITAVGSRGTMPIPADARQIDTRGQWVLPGLVDTNVHLSLYGGQNDRYETLAKYQPRQEEIVLEAAQIDLVYGITTVRDSYGALVPLTRVRDRTRGRAGRDAHPRRGQHSRWRTVRVLVQPRHGPADVVPGTDERLHRPAAARADGDDAGGAAAGDRRGIRQGAGLPEVRRHQPLSEPTFIGFSADVQRVIVEEAHNGIAQRKRTRRARRAPAVDRRRHRRYPASGVSRRPRVA
jgi:hypothetical protein